MSASQPSTSTAPQSGTLVTVPLEFIEKLVSEQRHNRALLDQIITKLPQLVQTQVQVAEERTRAAVKKDLDRLQLRLDSLEETFNTSISDTVRKEVEAVTESLARSAPPAAPPTLSVDALSQLFAPVPLVADIDKIWESALTPMPADKGKRKRSSRHDDSADPKAVSKEERKRQKRELRELRRQEREKEEAQRLEMEALRAGLTGGESSHMPPATVPDAVTSGGVPDSTPTPIPGTGETPPTTAPAEKPTSA